MTHLSAIFDSILGNRRELKKAEQTTRRDLARARLRMLTHAIQTEPDARKRRALRAERESVISRLSAMEN